MANTYEIMDTTYNTLTLERMKVYAQAALSPYMADRLEVASYMEEMTRQLVLKIQTEVMQHKVGEEVRVVPFQMTAPYCEKVVLEWPRSTWQEWKQRHPRVAKILPVKMRKSEVTLIGELEIRDAVKVKASYFNTFPEASVVYPPEFGPSIRVATFEQAVWHG